MTLPESEKQKIFDIVRRLTNEYRKECKVEISTIRDANGNLKLIMEDEYVQAVASYSVQDFEYIVRHIMRHYPGDLALYFGIYWQNELKKLYSIYSKKLKEKAFKVMGWS